MLWPKLSQLLVPSSEVCVSHSISHKLCLNWPLLNLQVFPTIQLWWPQFLCGCLLLEGTCSSTKLVKLRTIRKVLMKGASSCRWIPYKLQSDGWRSYFIVIDRDVRLYVFKSNTIVQKVRTALGNLTISHLSNFSKYDSYIITFF